MQKFNFTKFETIIIIIIIIIIKIKSRQQGDYIVESASANEQKYPQYQTRHYNPRQ